ncbi:MAG TPA: hypothetical protein VGE76_03945, partial [Opitutaceae bacterium]
MAAEPVDGRGLALLVVEGEGRHGLTDFAVGAVAARVGVLPQRERGGGHGLVGHGIECAELREREDAIHRLAHHRDDALALAQGSDVDAGDAELHRHRGHVARDLFVVDEQDAARLFDAHDLAADVVGFVGGLLGARAAGERKCEGAEEGEKRRFHERAGTPGFFRMPWPQKGTKGAKMGWCFLCIFTPFC